MNDAPIPEDVMLDAHDAYIRTRALAKGGTCIAGELIWSPIAAAIMAERNRCLQIAENMLDKSKVPDAIRKGSS